MKKKSCRSDKRGASRLRLLVLIAAGLVLGVNVYRWNAETLAGNALPMPFGWGAAVVMSGSMEPTLSVNDLVVIHEADGYEVGDIVVYQSGGSLVIHRIVDIRDETITARGDANNADDEPIPEIYVKGRLVLAVPGVGRLLRIVKSVPGTVVILAAAVFLLERSWRKEKNRDAEKMDAIKAEIRALQQQLQDAEKGEREDEKGVPPL